ncbi:MAG: methyltransferase domain-containing protein, partial [Terriglobia bacterium]
MQRRRLRLDLNRNGELSKQGDQGGGRWPSRRWGATALAGLQRGERVLDLGSGGGIDCFLASQQVGPEGHVTGLDMTDDMLSLA